MCIIHVIFVPKIVKWTGPVIQNHYYFNTVDFRLSRAINIVNTIIFIIEFTKKHSVTSSS